MSNEELVTAYEQGRLSRRAFIRRLTAGGMTFAAAAGYANLLGPGTGLRTAAQAQSFYDTTTTQPQTTTTQPQSTTTQPQSTTTQPQSTTTQPQSTTTQPQSTTTQPQSTTTQPTTTTITPATTTPAIVGDPTVTPGQTTDISGGGFLPGQVLTIDFFSVPTRLGTTRSDAAGNYRARVTIPANASPGVHEIVVSGPGLGGGTHRSVARVTVLAGTRPATPVAVQPRFTG